MNENDRVSTPSTSSHYTMLNHRNIEPISLIPEFDPIKMQINEWIEIIEYNSKIYDWTDNFFKFFNH